MKNRTEEEQLARKNSHIVVPFGFIMLDKMTRGFYNGELTLLAGYPSAGKTAFTVSVINNLTLDFER